MIDLTYEQFKACTRAHEAFAQRYWPFAQKYLQQYGILDSTRRCAAFLATISVESGNLEKTEEDLYYKDPLRIATLFKRRFDLDHDKIVDPEDIEAAKPFCRNPDALRDALYGNFPGRGLIQLTNEPNYQAYMNATGVDVISNPKLLREPEDAFRSACWFWFANGCNEVADSKTMREVTRIVNGPALVALPERTEVFGDNLVLLGA